MKEVGTPVTLEQGNVGKPGIAQDIPVFGNIRFIGRIRTNRIQMCKALGMNTICIYAFWNIHEQKPGEFDFSGQNDIAAFCRLAQKNGMYIMLRPGPYVCSEWEMGGLPWWLLKKEDIQLRTNDPYFIERTRIYMNEIGKQLADRQITRGGNIIMVQVENEYGSYATDKSYIAKNRDILRDAGFSP